MDSEKNVGKPNGKPSQNHAIKTTPNDPKWELFGIGLPTLWTYMHVFVEVSLEVKLPTIWRKEKQRWEESGKRRKEVRRSQKRKSEKKEDAGPRKGRKVAIHCVFPMICGSGGSKSNLATAAGAEPDGQMRDEKLQAVVVRSTFPSQNAQDTPFSDHYVQVKM